MIASVFVYNSFMFDQFTTIDELLSTLIMIATAFVICCFMFTEVVIVVKSLSTFITAINLTAMSNGKGGFTTLAQFLSGVGKQRGGALKRFSELFQAPQNLCWC